ncbi:MAG: hypothetical protein ACKVTZ_01985 [Bacteroidia bacterium]
MNRFLFVCSLFFCFSCNSTSPSAEKMAAQGKENSPLADSLAKVKLRAYDLAKEEIPVFDGKIPLVISAPDSAVIEPNVVSVIENGISITKGSFRVNIDIYQQLKEANETAELVKQHEWLQLKRDTSLAKVSLVHENATGFVYKIENKTTGVDYSFFYAVVKNNALYEIQPAMNMLGNYELAEIEWMYQSVQQK